MYQFSHFLSYPGMDLIRFCPFASPLPASPHFLHSVSFISSLHMWFSIPGVSIFKAQRNSYWILLAEEGPLFSATSNELIIARTGPLHWTRGCSLGHYCTEGSLPSCIRGRRPWGRQEANPQRQTTSPLLPPSLPPDLRLKAGKIAFFLSRSFCLFHYSLS